MVTPVRTPTKGPSVQAVRCPTLDPEPRRRTAVVVVNYASSELLRSNLTPLSRTAPDLDVVVVDNHSGEPEARAIGRLADDEGWNMVALPDNAGFGAGVNAGVQRARSLGADTFLLLNPDARITAAAVRALARRIAADPLSMVCPLIERPDGSAWFRGALVDLRRGRILSRSADPDHELAWLTGACVMTGVEVWDLVGGFDDDYFLYWEDVDLSVRAARAGARLEVCTDVTAVHDEGGTQDPGGRADDMSDAYYYFNIRNRLLFAAKLLTDEQWRRWIVHTPRESYRILLRGGGKRKFLRPWHPLGIAARGIRDGIGAGRAVRAAPGGALSR
jgi:N-acetylglucosaminyl-diphospho-decaprenol L-rhamnosyltransferase